jgi:D-threo-aldose 1-dehydrogenase
VSATSPRLPRPRSTRSSQPAAADISTNTGRGVSLPALGLGTGPLGNLYSPVSDDDAGATLERAWEAGIRYFDTAPLYGLGLAERRLGRFLVSADRASVVVSTKVGRLLIGGHPEPERRIPQWERDLWIDTPPGIEPVEDYRPDAVRRSFEGSLRRLGLDRVDIVNVHVPDRHVEEALRGAIPTLSRMRDEGVIGAIGVGTADVDTLDRFVRDADLDCILLAGGWTLIDRSAAESLLPLCRERGVAVIMGSVLAGGLLVELDAPGVAPAEPDPRAARIAAMRALCRRAGVSVIAAALQFPLQHPAVATVLVGARTAGEVDQDVAAFARTIPSGLWPELTVA